MTFFLMVIIGFALLLKIVIGAMYSIGYRCSHNTSEKSLTEGLEGKAKIDSKVDRFFRSIMPSM